uniref:Reverse transcriptase domain, reverse transcriptase zinc-binding domain protein n=1 Tax=Tanacetum cinerariifolium TaxID=118510 RepID=A0A6L2KFA2_TANCI|nr:reverse transcriptase domain, reverse transcriptase zinc-binding domain protein [Tanacetum cinerariifolium]
MKCAIAIRQLAYGTTPDTFDEYLQMRSWLGAPCEVGLINVYGPQSSSLKEILWSSIEHVVNSNSSDAIWIVFGDFNAVRCREERVGTNFDQREASVFNDFISRLRNKDMMEVVAISWSNCPDDSALLRVDVRLKNKIKKLRNDIRTWTLNQFAAHLKTKSNLITSLAEWAQKSCLKWEVEGDENTRFFHSSLQRKLAASTIKGINLNGTWCIIPDSIKAAVVEHFGLRSNANNLILILKCFEKASGLKMKLPKSRIFEVGIDIKDVETVASSLGCMHGSIPFMYLGLPVGKSMHFCEGWGKVVKPVRDRLSEWKAKSLSICGILTLIKFILCSIPIYYLSLFKAPDKIINLLESIHARFFWGFKDGAHVFYCKKALWRKVIRGFYGEDGGFGADAYVRGYKGVWCGILKSNSTINDIDPSLVDSFKLKVSNGSDRWGLVNGAWVGMWSWHYPPRGKALDDLASLVLVDDGMDKWVWSNDASSSSRRASINRLDTRLNLVNRGVSIDSDVSPFCKACGESVNHYLLICPKCGIWAVWNWRNKLVHAPLDDRAKVREDDIFPSIQRLSKTWISARSNIPSSYRSV